MKVNELKQMILEVKEELLKEGYASSASEKLEKIFGLIGYDDWYDFISDNPGASEVLIEWIDGRTWDSSRLDQEESDYLESLGLYNHAEKVKERDGIEEGKITKKKIVKENDEQKVFAQSLKTAKPGEYVWKLMSRYNPQLGTYYVFTAEKIEKVTPVSIFLSYGKYSKADGHKIDRTESAYGSAEYEIMNTDDARTINKEYKEAGESIRGFNE